MSKTCDCCPVCGSAGTYNLQVEKVGPTSYWIATIEQDEAQTCCSVTQLGRFPNHADAMRALNNTSIEALNTEMQHGGWDDKGYFIDNGPVDSDPYD